MARKRRRNEYLASLCKKQNLKHNKREPEVKHGYLTTRITPNTEFFYAVIVEEAVVINGNKRNKLQWKLGIITEVYSGRYDKSKDLRLGAGIVPGMQRLHLLDLS